MQQNYPFQPRGASGATPTAQATAAITAGVTQLALSNVPAEGCSMLIAVDGASNVAWSYGISAGLTINNGCFMLANTKQTFSLPGGVTQLSLIGASAAGNLRVTLGDGI